MGRGRIGEGEEKGALPPWRPAARAPWPPGALAHGRHTFDVKKIKAILKAYPRAYTSKMIFIQTDKGVLILYLDQSANLQP